jgi:hypothetical protein
MSGVTVLENQFEKTADGSPAKKRQQKNSGRTFPAALIPKLARVES